MRLPAWWKRERVEFWCPRREETGTVARGPDFWHKGKTGRSCSYCGSMHPDEFMDAARTGDGELGPTDKSYKVYVESPGVHRKFYFQHLPEANRSEFVGLYNVREKRDYDPDSFGTDFVLLRPGRMKLSYPGYFYTMPFFMGHRIQL